MNTDDLEYVGFWRRFVANLIDTVLLIFLTWLLLALSYGNAWWMDDFYIPGQMDFLFGWVVPAVVIILFWMIRQATPGKMAISARIVDARTGGAPSGGQCIGRYFAYIISAIPLFLGFIWIAFDSRKQGWHDKLAGTVVVRRRYMKPEPVSFDG